jgi:carbonic anhydrase
MRRNFGKFYMMKMLPRLLILLIFFLSCHANNQSVKKDGTDIGSLSESRLDILKSGNVRFVSGHPIHPDETLARIRELKKGQHPIAAVVSCSDSRVPPELIFDQGFGDIFSIRTAGNVIGDYELASVEYAVEHLGVNTVVVLGHQDCGAVQAYLEDTANTHTPGHIKNLVEYIRQEEEEKRLPEADRSNASIAVYANILHGMHTLKKSMPVLAPLYERKAINIIGGLYNMENGRVSFVEEN